MIEWGVVPDPPARPRAGHKGSFGTVLLVAGSPGMLGAAILAARGALLAARARLKWIAEVRERLSAHPRSGSPD